MQHKNDTTTCPVVLNTKRENKVVICTKLGSSYSYKGMYYSNPR